jgi:hypothetical protein
MGRGGPIPQCVDERAAWVSSISERGKRVSCSLSPCLCFHRNMTMALNSLRAYQAHAGRWASNFRETQQLVIFRVYLRLLNRSVEEGSYTAPRNNVVASRDDCRSAAYQTSVVAASASRAVIRDFESERASRQSPQSNGTAISGKATLPGQATSRTTTGECSLLVALFGQMSS